MWGVEGVEGVEVVVEVVEVVTVGVQENCGDPVRVMSSSWCVEETEKSTARL